MTNGLALSFRPARVERDVDTITRPSQSYWQDAWRRLRSNKRAMISLGIVCGLILFTIVGPALWTMDPSAQDLDQISRPPGADRRAVIVEPYRPWSGVVAAAVEVAPNEELESPKALQLFGDTTTQAVRLHWRAVPGAAGYRIYRNIANPRPDDALGLPLADNLSGAEVSFEDRLDLKPRRYYYSVVPLDEFGNEPGGYAFIGVDVTRVITADEAVERGLAEPGELDLGDTVLLPLHPFGTDYLGRDMLARLMFGAQVSLFIGIVAPFLYVLVGIAYGAVAGFLGGRPDHALMRFADFVVALPFLLFMILFRIWFGIQPGDSGVAPMMLAMVILSWPGTARLVRGQILQIREEGYIGASRLLGASTSYLILRHMLPNTMGVILVTLTFAVPGAIFTEAFLSFIGMGVAPPTPSWGSMCNEGIRTMLTHPHELIFPAVLISITVLAFNLLGDGLRDALDARMRSAE